MTDKQTNRKTERQRNVRSRFSETDQEQWNHKHCPIIGTQMNKYDRNNKNKETRKMNRHTDREREREREREIETQELDLVKMIKNNGTINLLK
jgi:hypothetical protein